MQQHRGFTLIELLVVIAIIGILSGIVLTSLNTAREKAKIAAAKANLGSIRTSIEMYYDDLGTYEGFFASSEGSSMWQSVVGLGPEAFGAEDTAGEWAAAFDWDNDLGTTENNFCIDSTGFAGKGTRGGSDGTVCIP